MPQPPTTYMLLVLPTEGGDSDVWDQLINEAIGGVNGIDAHDHSDGRGKRVSTGGLNIDADLSMNNHRLTTVRGLALQSLGGLLSAGSLELFTDGTDFYFRNALGQNVRITNGATLDVTSVGGIAGDYSAIGAEVAYVDASDTYTMRQQLDTLVRQFARVACAGIDIFEYKAAGITPVPPNRVRLSSPPALAASYELQLPAALPAAQSLLQVSPAGVITAAPAPPVTQSLLQISPAGVISASNTLPEIRHGQRTMQLAVVPAQNPVATLAAVTTTAIGFGVTIPLHVGDRILRLRAVVLDAVGGANTVLLRLSSGIAGAVETPSGAGAPSSGANTVQTIQSAVLSTPVVSGTVYRAVLVYNSGAFSFTTYLVEVDYDHP